MPRSRIWSLARMIIGSVIGVIGFGTLSLAFVHLSAGGLAAGLVEILVGAFIALGVMSPLRKHHTER